MSKKFFVLKHQYLPSEVSFVPPKEIIKGCQKSEFQYLSHREITVELQEEDGTRFPDFLLINRSIPFISSKMKDVYDRMGIDNLFYKGVKLTIPKLGIEQSYWLALPPRIRCVDLTDPNNDFGFDFKVKIIPERVGNYKIFRLEGVGNNEIIIDEELKLFLEESDLSGIKFSELQGGKNG